MSDKAMTHIGARHPVRFLARNFRGHMKNLKRGKIWLGEFEMERDIWDTLDASLPEDAMFEVILWVVDGDPVGDEKPEEKSKKPKGEWGPFWQEMFRRGFYNSPELCEALQADSLTADSARQLLHDAFETTSLSLVSPLQFEEFCATHELHNLFTMSRTASARVEEQADARAS